MTYSLSKITVATLFALSSVAGLAAPNSSANVSGAYAQGSVGWGNNNSITTIFETNVKQTGVQGNIAGGYLWAMPDNWAFGAELSGTYYPKSSSDISTTGGTTKTNAYSINVLGVAKYFVSDVWSFVAKAGPSFYQTKTTITAPGSADTTQNGHSTGLMGDLGVAYNVTPALAVTVDAQMSRQWIVGGGETTTTNPYAILAGVSYNFGAA
jgi:hypothetical protein